MRKVAKMRRANNERSMESLSNEREKNSLEGRSRKMESITEEWSGSCHDTITARCPWQVTAARQKKIQERNKQTEEHLKKRREKQEMEKECMR